MPLKTIKLSHICGIFFLGFCLLAFLSFIFAGLVTRQKVEHADLSSVYRGKWAATYEDKFDESLPHYSFSVGLWGRLGYLLFREGRKGVLVGSKGWLFTTEEFDFPNDFETILQQKVGYIDHVRNRLEEKGIKLFVVPVPAKARVYKEFTGLYQYPSYWEGRYPAFLTLLKGQKVEAIDLMKVFPAFTANLYLRTDTHWTPEGARIAAQSIAEKTTRIWPYLVVSHQPFIVRRGKQEEHRGDLMRYVALGDNSGGWGLKPDVIQRVHTENPTVSDDLFGDVSIPVALVGTSYSANPIWNFDGFLKEALQADVLNAADDGLGPFETMEKYLSDKSFEASPPKLVIWEIPERYLAVPDNIPHYD